MAQAAELLDTDLGDNDVLPPIANFIAAIEQVVREQPRAIELVGGNILIHVRDVGTWVVVTRGVRKGIYREATDDEVAFALVCEEWVLLDLLEPGLKSDCAKLAELGFLYVQGDVRVYERFMQLAEQKNMLSVRAGMNAESKAKPSTAKKAVRKVA